MATWFAAHNYTPADPSSLQAVVPVDGAYTDLVSGDMALVYLDGQMDVFVYDSTSSATQNVPHIVTSDGNAGNGRWIRKEVSTAYSNGFDVQVGPQPDSLATIGVSGTTFTLTFVAEYSFFVQGAKYTVSSGNKTVEITDVEGLHWIYFDNTGTLQIQAPGGSTDELILENCLVAAAYWDATNNVCTMLFDERHGSNMTPTTHYHAHETFGARYETGLGLSGFDTGGDGTAATHAQFDLNSGEFHDEDNEITIATALNATIDTFYRLGVGGPWRKLAATTNYPVADPQTGTRMDWNDYNGGTWQLQEVANNDYVLTHYFATNDQLGATGVIGIMGQADYGTLPAAQAGAETELTSLLTGDLPLTEVLPIATVIWRTTNGSSNQVAGAIMSVSGGGDYVDWRTSDLTGAGVSVSDHESLSGLLGGAAADHYHLTGAQETDLTDGGDTDLHQHDTLQTGAVDTILSIAGGGKIMDDSGSNPQLNFRTDGDVRLANFSVDATSFDLQLWAGAAYETALVATHNVDVQLYYNGTKRFATQSSGGLFYADNANLGFRTDADVRTVNINAQATTFAVQLYNGAAWEDAIKAFHNGTVQLFYNDIEALSTETAGVSVYDTSGTDPSLYLRGSGDQWLGSLHATSAGIGLRAGSSSEQALWAATDGAVELYYDNVKSFETYAGGIMINDTSGNDPTIKMRDDADGELVRMIGSGTANDGQLDIEVYGSSGWETSAIFNDDGGVELYYDNIKAFGTHAAGISVYDTSGTDPYITFVNSSGTGMGRVRAATTGTMKIQNWNGSTYEDSFVSNVNGAVELYYDATVALKTTQYGIDSWSSDATESLIYLRNSAGTADGLIYTHATGGMILKSFPHGGNFELQTEDGSGVEKTVFKGRPGGSGELYYNGTECLITNQFGITVQDTDGTDPTVYFNDSSDNVLGLIFCDGTDMIYRNEEATVTQKHRFQNESNADIFHVDSGIGFRSYYNDGATKNLTTGQNGLTVWSESNDGDCYIGFQNQAGSVWGNIQTGQNGNDDFTIYNTKLSGKFIVYGEDAGSTKTSLIEIDPDTYCELYYDGVRSFRTDPEGIRVYDTSGDNPVLDLSEDGSVVAGYFKSVSGVDMYLQSVRDGGDLWLSASDSSSVDHWVGILPDANSFHPSPDNHISCGRAANEWTAVYANNGTIQSSDGSLKEKLGDGLGLEFIEKLSTLTYRWKDGGVRPHEGFDARQVKEVMDELGIDFAGYIDPNIKEESEDGLPMTLKLNYSEFIPPLVRSVHELKRRITLWKDAAQTRIEDLEALTQTLYTQAQYLTEQNNLKTAQLNNIESRLSALENPTT